MINRGYTYYVKHFIVGHISRVYHPGCGMTWSPRGPLTNHHLVDRAQCCGAVLQHECDCWHHIWVTCWHHHDNSGLGSKHGQMSLGYWWCHKTLHQVWVTTDVTV